MSEGLRRERLVARPMARRDRQGALTLFHSAVVRRDAVAFFGAVLVPLAVFIALGVALAGKGAHGWDADVVRFVERHYRESLSERLNKILDASMGIGAAVSIAAVLVLLATGRRLHAAFWMLAVGGVVALDVPLKEIFHRQPIGDPGGGYSFPSGNAMVSAAIAVALVLTFSPRWRRPAFIASVPLVLGYGGLLVIQSWHYPSDVVAGWCFAVAWTSALWFGFRRATRASKTRTWDRSSFG